MSLDPVPWESSGSLNAGRHRRGSGRAVQIVPPIRALVQQAPGSSTLGCISRRTLPNDGNPQAFLPSVRSRGEHAQVVSQGHGQMHQAMDANRDLVSYCARPQLQLHTPTRSLPPAQPTLTACPIPATKIEGSTQSLASDILWYLLLCRQSSKHWLHTAVLQLQDYQPCHANSDGLSGNMATERKIRNRHQKESTSGAASTANPGAENPSRLLQQVVTLHAVGTNRPEPIVISTTLPTVQPFSLEGFSAPLLPPRCCCAAICDGKMAPPSHSTDREMMAVFSLGKR